MDKKLSAADKAGLAWGMNPNGHRGERPEGSFPRWMDRACDHPTDRQFLDLRGMICLECGAVQIIW